MTLFHFRERENYFVIPTWYLAILTKSTHHWVIHNYWLPTKCPKVHNVDCGAKLRVFMCCGENY